MGNFRIELFQSFLSWWWSAKDRGNKLGTEGRLPRIPDDSSKGVDCRGGVVALGSTRTGYGLLSKPDLLQGMMTS